MPSTSNPSLVSRFRQLGPAARLGLIAGCAFAVGFLLFVLAVLSRPNPSAGDVLAPANTPLVVVSSGLPVPEADGPDSASGIELPDEEMLQQIALQRAAEQAAEQADPWTLTSPETEQPAIAALAPDAPARVTHAPAPAYPGSAMRRRESGEVLLHLQVGSNGRLRNVEILRSSGSRALDRAATQAVRRWRFEPARRNGAAVDGTLQIPIQFTL